ncbi:MAG: hypothetical protein Q27BB25_05150 [Blastomonas sp. CACIA14H2]|nr:MAG: hypothetical protein Q27BB25_05150 [Blastomonas sp. CACIA14H2]
MLGVHSHSFDLGYYQRLYLGMSRQNRFSQIVDPLYGIGKFVVFVDVDSISDRKVMNEVYTIAIG